MIEDYTKHPGFDDHKLVQTVHDKDTELLAIIAIHNDDLGPALGGTRMFPYASYEDALTDALRLSAGMTRKAALAGLNYGGGKAIIIGEPKTKNRELLLAYARKINRLNGQYITAEDVNISVDDIEIMAEVTPYLCGRSDATPKGSGDPSIMTAFGVFRGIQACLTHLYGNSSVAGKTVAIQGVGKVGFRLMRLLHQNKAEIIFCDSNPHMVERALQEFKGSKCVPTEEIYNEQCDIFSPCAMGAIINPTTIPDLKCKIIAGAANNQLSSPEDGHSLLQHGIIYAVDYVINAGGLINVATEIKLSEYDASQAKRATAKIYDRILYILKQSKTKTAPPHEIAEEMVKEIIDNARRMKEIKRKLGLI